MVKANAGGFLRITATGSIYDVAPGAYAATATGYISLIADGDIGTNSQSFRVNVAANSVLLLQSGGSSYIEQ